MPDITDLQLDLRLSWRNIGRNRRRSLLFGLAVAVGLFGLLVSVALIHGLGEGMLEEMIGSHIGDVQVAREGFNDNPVLGLTMEDPVPVQRVLETTAGISAWAPRLLLQGMARSSRGSQGVQVVGIDPDRERRVTTISDRVTAGTYPVSARGAGVLIGEELARRLRLEVGQRLVLFAQGTSGDLVSVAWSISGTYRTSSPDFDRMTVFTGIDDLRELLGVPSGVSMFTLRAGAASTAAGLDEELSRAFAGGPYEVLFWGEVVPILLQSIEMWDFYTYIFFMLVFVAMVFGIMNTMTMAVFERVQEFGVLSALGTRPGRLFRVVMLEATLLGVLGLAAGYLAVGIFLLLTLGPGIDLSVFSQALASIGSGSVIHPSLRLRDFFFSGGMALFFAVVSSILPALRATRFQPVEALRHV